MPRCVCMYVCSSDDGDGNGGGSSLVGKACFLQRCMQRPTYIETQEFNFRASRERYRDH